jgi:plastocyanin
MTRSLPVHTAIIMAFSIGLMPAHFCLALPLQVAVVDARSNPVAEIVITVTPVDTASANPKATPVATTAIMDQINKEFVPEVLVVRTGAIVSFPNSDSVAHQVYSFSNAKRFSLPLYRGKPYPPVIFDRAGIVTLGCNIHDHMIGYIVVTDAPYFGQTNKQGEWSHELPQGTYRIRAWHPRLNEPVTEQSITISDLSAAHVTFALAKSLRPVNPRADHRIRDY